jgi:hypothetical protein
MPERIQMTRQLPWRADHPDAVIVSRPSKWGNRWRVARVQCSLGGMCWGVATPEDGIVQQHAESEEEAARWAVQGFERDIRSHACGYGPAEVRAELAGRDVACWCRLDRPCHANVLLEIANGPTE